MCVALKPQWFCVYVRYVHTLIHAVIIMLAGKDTFFVFFLYLHFPERTLSPFCCRFAQILCTVCKRVLTFSTVDYLPEYLGTAALAQL